VQRWQRGSGDESARQGAETAAASRATSHAIDAVPDPWLGGLKERGVRRYLDAVAKVQAGGAVALSGLAMGNSSAVDEAGAGRDEEFEQHMQHLQWQRRGKSSAKVAGGQHAPLRPTGTALEKAKRRAAASNNKMTDEQDASHRQQRRVNELKALGLDPSTSEGDVPLAAAAMISELEEELQRLRLENLDDDVQRVDAEHLDSNVRGDEDGAKGCPGRHALDVHRHAQHVNSKHGKVLEVSSSDDAWSQDDNDAVVDHIIAHERHAGQGELGGDEARCLALELSRLKAKLEEEEEEERGEDADVDDADAYQRQHPAEQALQPGAPTGLGIVQQSRSAQSAATANAAKSSGWGSRIKNLFFGKGPGHGGVAASAACAASALTCASTQQSSAKHAASHEVDASIDVAPSAASRGMVKPPMATPSVQGNMQLSIKVGAGSSKSLTHADKPAPRMMTALPEHQDDINNVWSDDELLPAATFEATGMLGDINMAGEEGTPRMQLAVKLPPAPLRIGTGAAGWRGVSASRLGGNMQDASMQDAIMEADAMLDAFAPPSRAAASGLVESDQSAIELEYDALATVGKGKSGTHDIANVEALMQRVKAKMLQMESGDQDPNTVEEIRVLKAKVAHVLAGLELSEQHEADAAVAEADEQATPRMQLYATPRLGSMAAHVAQQRVEASAPGAEPPMLKSFFQNLDEAEHLPLPSQRSHFSDDMHDQQHMDESYDDDTTETMSMMSMATAVVDQCEMERKRHARPAPRHQRPVNVPSEITPVGFSGVSQTVYHEGGEQDRWLNDAQTPRSLVATSVANSEHTQVLGRDEDGIGVRGLPRSTVCPSPHAKGASVDKDTACAPQQASATRALTSAYGKIGDEDVGMVSDERKQLLHVRRARQVQKEGLQALQLKLQCAAAAPRTAVSNVSFHTEDSDELDSVRSHELRSHELRSLESAQTPRQQHSRLVPPPLAKLPPHTRHTAASSATRSADKVQEVASHDSDATRVKGGAARWAPGVRVLHLHDDNAKEEAEDEEGERVPLDPTNRTKVRAAQRTARRSTLEARPRRDDPSASTSAVRQSLQTLAHTSDQRPGTGESALSNTLVEEKDVFEDSDDQEYDEGHAGIVNRQHLILAENMALVLGGADDVASEWGEHTDLGDLSVVDAPASTSTQANGIREEDSRADDESDPLMKEMKSKAKLRAQRARVLEASDVAAGDGGGLKVGKADAARPTAHVGVDVAASPSQVQAQIRVSHAMVEHSKSHPKHALHGHLSEHMHTKSKDSEHALAPSPTVVLEKTHDETMDQEMNERCAPRGLLRTSASLVKKQVGASARQAAAGTQEHAVHSTQDKHPLFSPHGTVGVEKHKLDAKNKLDAHVPVVRVERRPLSASSIHTSRSSSRTPRNPTVPLSDVFPALPLHNSALDSGNGDDDPSGPLAMFSHTYGPTHDLHTTRQSAHRQRATTPPSPCYSSDKGGARSDDDKVHTTSKHNPETSSPRATHGESSTLTLQQVSAPSWIQENAEVNAMKERAARPLSERDEVRNYSAILTSQLGFLGPLPSVSMPKGGSSSDDSDQSRRHKKKSKKKSLKKLSKAKAPAPRRDASSSSQASGLSDASFDSAVSRGGSPLSATQNVRAPYNTMTNTLSDRERDEHIGNHSKMSSGKNEAWEAQSSGSEGGLPEGFGHLHVKHLMPNAKHPKTKKAKSRSKPSYSLDYGSSGNDASSNASVRPKIASTSDEESLSTRRRAAKAGSQKAVQYQVRAMPDGSTKRVEMNESLEEVSGDGHSTRRSTRCRHVLNHGAHAAPFRSNAPEENVLEKVERLQREARVMREAAEHARRQEALREAAERENRKAQRQVQELQKQLQEARTGRAAVLQAGMMQMHMGPEASGEDELNAYRMRSSKPPLPLLSAPQQLQVNSFQQKSSVVIEHTRDELHEVPDVHELLMPELQQLLTPQDNLPCQHKVKTAPPVCVESRVKSVKSSDGAHSSDDAHLPASTPCNFFCTMPAFFTTDAATAGTGESRASTAGSQVAPYAVEQLKHEDNHDDDDDYLPPELVHRLQSVSARLIQQSCRKRRTLCNAQCSAAPAPCSKHGVHKQGAHMAATWSGGEHLFSTSLSKSASFSTSARGCGAYELSATAMTGLGMGSGKGRTSTAHIMLGASVTGAQQVPASIKALQVALTRSGLATAVEAFVWLNRGGKNGLAQPLLTQALTTLCASNINVGQLMFDLNPQSPDARVSVEEFVAAMHWASSGSQSPPPAQGSLWQQLADARAGLKQLEQRVHQGLHRSTMSNSLPASAFMPTPPCSLPVSSTHAQATSGPQVPRLQAASQESASQHSGHAKQDKANPSILPQARALFKRCGFRNVAEVFVFVESCSGTRAHGAAVAAVAGHEASVASHDLVSGDQVLQALKALHLTREISATHLLHALGKPSDGKFSDLISYRDFVQHVSWECVGLSADAWKPKGALEAARLEKSKVMERVKRHVDDVHTEQRQVKEAELLKLADGTRAATLELAALRKLAASRTDANARSITESSRRHRLPTRNSSLAPTKTYAATHTSTSTDVSLPPLVQLARQSSGGKGLTATNCRPAPAGIQTVSAAMGGGGPAASRIMAREHLHAVSSLQNRSSSSSRAELR